MSMMSWFQKKDAREFVEETGLEKIVELKLERFFERMGKVEAESVHRTVIRQVERPLIKKSLQWAGGNKLKAARVLGINRNTLAKKVKEYGIE